MTDYSDQAEQTQKRPVLLTVLAILSFISIGLAIIMNLFSLMGGPMSDSDIKKERIEIAKSKTEFRSQRMDGMVTFFDKLENMIVQTNDNFYLSKGIMMITDIIGLFGVILMMRRRKLGFHLYIVYSLIALGGMYLYLSPENIHISLPIVNATIAALFIFLYSRTLKWMQ